MFTTVVMGSVEDFEKNREYTQLLERQNALLKEQIADLEELNGINNNIIEVQKQTIVSLKESIRTIKGLM